MYRSVKSLFIMISEVLLCSRDGTLVGYVFSKRYKKVSPHRKSHNLLYNLLGEKNKPPQEMVNKRGVPIGPTIARSGISNVMKPYFYESFLAHHVDTMIHYSTLPCCHTTFTTTVVSGIFCLL